MVSSSSSNYQPISFSGLVSGLDTKSLIQQMLDARKGPIQSLQNQVYTRQQENNALRDINSRLTNLLTQAKKFADLTYVQGKSAAVTAGGAAATVAVSADASAAVGSFKITVNKLADATRVSSGGAIGAAIDANALLKDTNLGQAVTAGTFTVNGTQISVDPTTDTLTTVMQRIRDNVAGVTVSLVADGSGRNNLLQIAGGATVTLGAGGDTSNFLSATNLLASPSGATRTSTGNIGVAQTGALLSSARLVTALSVPSGSFKVNGVEIAYDSSKDSLSTVLSRINNSTAGVTASYDSVNDKVTIVSRGTGSVGIQFQDITGNFLDAIGVRTATQTLGNNAQYQIDTGSGPITRYSTTNTVTDAVPGITLSLLKEGTSADTVTVSQDLDGAVSRARDLVGQFNSAVDFIRTQTAFNKTGLNGTLAGDFSINQINDTLRRLVTEPIDGITTGKTTLAEIGISFGAVGSAVGSTNTLVLDENKFRSALQSDPVGVANVLGAFRATGALAGGGTGGLDGVSGDPSGVRRPGKYSITTTMNTNGTGYLTAVFTPDDGGPTVTTTVDNVAAGSTNSTLIPGMTLTMKSTLTAGTDTITVATPTRGLGAKLEQFLDTLTRSDGVLSKRQDSANDDIKRMNDQIQEMNDRISRERDRLTAKFAAMESALSRLQEQKSALSSLGG